VSDVSPKVLKLSSEVSVCKPLMPGMPGGAPGRGVRPVRARALHGVPHAVAPDLRELLRSRGLHSFASQLNLSALYGIGGARRGCVADVKEVLGGVWCV